MAYYEYECAKCEHKFEVKQSFEEHDRHKKVACPKCGSDRVEPLLSAASVVTKKKS